MIQSLEKLLFIDTETTGLDSDKNDIIQVAGIIEINKEVKEEFNFNVQPKNWDTIEESALKVNKITLEEMKLFPTLDDTHSKLIKVFEKYINRYDKNDKFTVIGQNISFDTKFLRSFFKNCNDKYFGSFINFKEIDLMTLTWWLNSIGLIDVANLKLEDTAKSLGFTYDAHNALEDVRMTRKVYYHYVSLIKKEDILRKE